MAFETGNPSFRMFRCGEGMSDALIEAFRRKMAPPIKTLSTSPIEGWVGWRHLLDRNLDEENCLFVPWLYISRMRAERKIPPALLRAYCKTEEAEELKRRNLEFLPAQVKREIRDRLIDQMTPEMPPTLTGAGTVFDLATGLIYTESTATKAAEAFAQAFRDTTGHSVAAYSPEGAAAIRCGVNANDLQPAMFTDDPTVEPSANCNLGLEFLTWAWYRWEEESDMFETSRGENMRIELSGPVSFFNEGKGAFNVVIRNGVPLQSREAGVAMLCGKKVKQIKLAIGDGERAWNATIDSDFVFKSVRLPKDKSEPRQSFYERMGNLETFVEAVFSLFDIFLKIRADGKEWRKTEAKMKAWVRRRATAEDGRVSAS